MPLGTKVGLGRIVLHREPALPPKRGATPQFVAVVNCVKTVAHLSCCWALFCEHMLFCHDFKNDSDICHSSPTSVLHEMKEKSVWRQKSGRSTTMLAH